MKMNTETIIYCVFAVILGMLVFHMLKNVCGCQVVEGQSSPCNNTIVPSAEHPPVANHKGCSSIIWSPDKPQNSVRDLCLKSTDGHNNCKWTAASAMCSTGDECNLINPGAAPRGGQPFPREGDEKSMVNYCAFYPNKTLCDDNSPCSWATNFGMGADKGCLAPETYCRVDDMSSPGAHNKCGKSPFSACKWGRDVPAKDAMPIGLQKCLPDWVPTLDNSVYCNPNTDASAT